MNVAGPEVEEYEGVVQIKYDSDGVLAVPEGAEYSRQDGEFEVADSNQLLTIKEGSEVYLESEVEFAAYDIEKFAKAVSEASGDTDIWDPNNTKVWDPGKTSTDSDTTTSIFDTSTYDIDDPTEYTKMMKENADTIIIELAERGITGQEATKTLDTLFKNMNETYESFVHSSGQEESSDKDTELYQKKPEDDSEPSKDKVSQNQVEQDIREIDQRLEESRNSSKDLDSYIRAEELLAGEQTEIQEFETRNQSEGEQSEISDWG